MHHTTRVGEPTGTRERTGEDKTPMHCERRDTRNLAGGYDCKVQHSSVPISSGENLHEPWRINWHVSDSALGMNRSRLRLAGI